MDNIRAHPLESADRTHVNRAGSNSNQQEFRMNMLYGVNQADQCWDFALGESHERIGELLREIDTRMVRLFLFDKGGPDPVIRWPDFAAYVQAVLNIGATPMITFAKLNRPLDDPRAIRWFANQCSDVVWNCIEQWGGDVVKDWYWCVWNEPNNEWISGPVSFEQYRQIYEAIAEQVVKWIGPYLGNRKPLIGGPAVEGFQPFWMDWVWRFVNEIDNSLIGFVDWHRYADWRDCGENGAPADEDVFCDLMMSQAHDYELRARAIGQILKGRDILNICGELNTHSHYTDPVRKRFNHSIFGATYYAAALLNLIRARVHAEMFWTGTEDEGGYGMMNKYGEPWPVFYSQKLCAQHIRTGDWVSFPDSQHSRVNTEVAVARGESGRKSAVIVHLKNETRTFSISELTGQSTSYRWSYKIDGSTDARVEERSYDGTVNFQGYGVAAVST